MLGRLTAALIMSELEDRRLTYLERNFDLKGKPVFDVRPGDS